LDVQSPPPGETYGIPSDNPYVEEGAPCRGCFMDSDFSCGRTCPEVWASGLRNPWRCSFDDDQRLWCGDVGRAAWEEINLVEPGKNYGWSCREGDDPSEVAPDELPCDGTYAGPAFAYAHGVGTAAITGGRVYRGRDFPDLVGTYVY